MRRIEQRLGAALAGVLTAPIVGASMKQRLAAMLAWAALGCAAAPAAAQDSGTFGAKRHFNWAYGAAFGTGTYELADGASTVSLIRLPINAKLREPGAARGCRCGVRLLFPITIGVENLDLGDLGDFEDLRERTNEFAFFPGIEFVLPRTEHWALKITGQVGAGLRTDGDRERSRLYGAGIRSRYAWPEVAGRPAIINGLYWSAYEPEDDELHDLARFSAGLEFDVPVRRWQFNDASMRLIPHVLTNWYFRPAEIDPILSGEATDLSREWELGLAAGREGGFSLFGAKFDSVGIAFRHSASSRGIRLFVGSIF
jgi:hypothetical protein